MKKRKKERKERDKDTILGMCSHNETTRATPVKINALRRFKLKFKNIYYAY
jgi:hypothetical protein